MESVKSLNLEKTERPGWKKILSVVAKISGLVGGVLVGYKYGQITASGLGLVFSVSASVSAGLVLLGGVSGAVLGAFLGSKLSEKISKELDLS